MTRFIVVVWNRPRSVSEVCLYVGSKTVIVTVPRGLLDHGCHKGKKARRKVNRWLVVGHPGEFVLIPVPLAVVVLCEVGNDLTVGTARPTFSATQVGKSRG